MKPGRTIEVLGTITCPDLSSAEFVVKKSVLYTRSQQENLPNTASLP